MRLLLEGGSSHLKPQAGRRECTGNGQWLLKPQSLAPMTYILHHGCNKALQIATNQGQSIKMSENMGDTSHLNHYNTDRILQLMHQRTCLTFKSCQQNAFRRLWVRQVVSCSVGPGRIDRNALGEDSLCSMTQETFFICRGGQSVNINIVCLPTLMSRDMCSINYVHSSVVCHGQNLETAQMPLDEEWMGKVWCICMVEYYQVEKNWQHLEFCRRMDGAREHYFE